MLPNIQDRQHFLSSSNNESVRLYFNNLHNLALKDKSYKSVYKEDYDFYNNLQQGGVDPLVVGGITTSLLATGIAGAYAYNKLKHKESTCENIVGEDEVKFCEDLRTKLKYISQTLQKNLFKTELTSKIKNAIKLFIDNNICCDEIYNNELMRDIYIDYVILIIKIIKKSNIMTTFATNYVYELYTHNPELFYMHYIKDYKNFYNAKTLIDKNKAFEEINKHFSNTNDKTHGQKIDISAALRTAFFMRFMKEDIKKLKLVMNAEQYINLAKI